MSVETYDIHTDAAPAVTVTAAAIAHLRRQLAPKGLAAVRIHLEKSGCTGYKYVIDEVAAPQEGDLTLALGDGLALCLPAGDLPQLNGMELDFVQEGVNRRLVINNPNAKDACGCGESFSF
ncbi:MAG: iron-sulfur cluster assembly accessory protein [Porticoccaceae bacterium]|jgi:Fe-S cluster assembly protein SufA|nr:iron-sulfur cluster assembly accessory protein [Porticoccaceae bacterium]MEA3299895.1 iron-sulfur cluster assembly accessory protein [Pseudomonadota bacterium]HLS97822.1 iron-sulfur cluster assembly accessory protein [Porticoccaceae bacterium]